jgi:phage-related holin
MSKFLEWIWVGWLAVWVDMVIPFFIPIRGYLLFMLFAIIFDTITGIIAARAQKIPITSRGIWRTIEKIVIAFIAIMLSEGFRIVFMPEIPITMGVSAIIAAAEVKSNFENYYKITGVDIATTIYAQIKDRLFPNNQNTPTDETK